jgi:transcriptional regulator with XRE-family HTH domain
MSAIQTNHSSDQIRNMVGPQIRKLRYARGLSQSKLAIRLQIDGLDVSRDVVAQMECQRHCIRDNHIFYFARVLAVNVSEIFAGLKNEKL